jgi:hypothetical protein
MRTKCVAIILVLLLFCGVEQVQAGFLVRKSGSYPVAEHTTGKQNIGANARAYSHLKRLSSKAHPAMRYNPYRQNQWFGIAAIIAGTLGFFIPGMYLLAMLFGLLGIGRKCKAQGLAIAGLALGLAELGLFLLTGSVFLALILF